MIYLVADDAQERRSLETQIGNAGQYAVAKWAQLLVGEEVPAMSPEKQKQKDEKTHL